MFFQIYAIVVKEFKLFLKDREALTLLFAMPAFFILVMSLALETVYEAGSKERPLEIIVINEDHGPRAQEVLNTLKKHEALSFKRLCSTAQNYTTFWIFNQTQGSDRARTKRANIAPKNLVQSASTTLAGPYCSETRE